MITRRSFLYGAAWAAALPFPVLGPGGGGSEEPPRYTELPDERLPGNYPYDKPVPSLRSEIMAPLSSRVVAGYWTSRDSPIRLADIPEQYNTVFLFHATPVGGAPGTTGAVQWSNPGNARGAATHFRADLAELRRTRTAILTVGGAEANVDLSTRTRAVAFLDSVQRIYGDLGGFDGLDWNNYEGEQQPNTDQMIWISQQLKALYGQSFAITSPPAPWRPADVAHCRAMIDAGAMDMVSPQYYDGPGLAGEGYIVNSVNDWVARMGDASRVGVGFGLSSADNYSTRDAIEGAWRTLAARHPALRGAYNWNITTDERMGWPFANTVGPVVMADAPSTTRSPTTIPPFIPVPAPIPHRTHTVVAGDTLAGVARRYGIADWHEIAALNDNLVPESLYVGQVLKLPNALMTRPVTENRSSPGVGRLPAPVVGTYWFPDSGQRLNTVHQAYNVVWIASPGETHGEALKCDMAELRKRTISPKLILSSFDGPDKETSLPAITSADEFAAHVIRISTAYGFDGFNWDRDHAPNFSIADLERASRAIVTEMRKINPAFSLTVASHPEPGGKVTRNKDGRVYADFARRCEDIIDLVQPE